MAPDATTTTSDPRSKRPVKKRALTPVSAQAAGLDALFARPDQEIRLSPPRQTRLAPPPPEIVTNVQGSSAGAGSGEFHVYKAARRREHARVAAMEAEVASERAAVDFEARKRELEARDDEKTRRNREKREKMRARKAKAKAGGGKNGSGGNSQANGAKGKQGLSANKRNDAAESDEDMDDGTAKPPQAPVVVDGPGLLIHDDD